MISNPFRAKRRIANHPISPDPAIAEQMSAPALQLIKNYKEDFHAIMGAVGAVAGERLKTPEAEYNEKYYIPYVGLMNLTSALESLVSRETPVAQPKALSGSSILGKLAQRIPPNHFAHSFRAQKTPYTQHEILARGAEIIQRAIDIMAEAAAQHQAKIDRAVLIKKDVGVLQNLVTQLPVPLPRRWRWASDNPQSFGYNPPMNEDIMNIIRLRQKAMGAPVPKPLQPQKPHMLYIGCIDARLDPIDDIGIPKGEALIYRNIGALVPQCAPAGSGLVNPESVSIGATLEFFLKQMPWEGNEIKHIVVSGHTSCGGLGHACRHAHHSKREDSFLMRYLSPVIETIRSFLGAKPAPSPESLEMRACEQESVRQSRENLRSYPFIKELEDQGKIQLHGWVIDTATQRIEEYDEEENKFKPMWQVTRFRRSGAGTHQLP